MGVKALHLDQYQIERSLKIIGIVSLVNLRKEMIMTNEDILKIADKHLGFSDFGNFYGKADDILEFANDLIIAYYTEREAQLWQRGSSQE
jgi:hypothetical protein